MTTAPTKPLRIVLAEVQVPPWVPAAHADTYRYGVCMGWAKGVRECQEHYGLEQDEPDDEPEPDDPA